MAKKVEFQGKIIAFFRNFKNKKILPVAQIEWDIAEQSTKVILEMNFATLPTLWSGQKRMTN